MKNDILRRFKKSNLSIYRNFTLLTAKLGLALTLIVVAGCGGSGGDGGITGSVFYTIGGTVSGLVGTVVLQDNGADDLSVSANGAFTFATEIADGAAYHVTVKTQPSGQTCTASSNTGTIAGANVTNVSVVCAVNTYTVGGTVSGLTGTVVLQDNGADDLSISSDGTFTFATPVADGGGYSVTVKTQPTSPNQTCTASSNTGTIAGANVTNVSVVCAVNTYTVGGTVSGLTGTVVLQDNGAADLSISTNGTFTFATKIADGAGYNVTVKTPHPAGQKCMASSNTGTIAGAAVTDVSVDCVSWTGTKQLGVSGKDTQAYSVAMDSLGNVYVAGWTNGGLDSNPLMGNTDFFVTMYDAAGNKVRTKQLGVSGKDTRATSVAVDSLGNVYVAGYTYGDLDGNTLTGLDDFFVTKYSSAGTKLFTNHLGVSGHSAEAYGVAVDSLDNVYVAGYTDGDLDGIPLMGTTDFFVTMYNSAGSKLRTRKLGVSGAITYAGGVAVDSNDYVYVAGYTYGGLDTNTLTGVSDFFVTMYDSSGNKQ
jgi:hypothetical protein